MVVFDAVDHVGELLQTNGHAVLVSHDQRPVGGGARQLAAGLHGEGLLLAVQFACRQVHVAALNGLHYVVETDAARGHLVGIQLHAHRVFLRAINLHAGNAAGHRKTLRQQGLRVFVHGVERQCVGSKRKVQHRLVGRISLLVRRRMRHVGGQQALRFGDGGLNILRGGVDVARQRELYGDLRGSLGVLRVHALHARDGGELALERRGDGRSHGFRVGARQRGVHLDVRVIDRRQGRHRQRPEGHDPEQQNR